MPAAASIRSVTDLDHRLGDAVRRRRQAAGLSQEKLGEALGVTFQQVQKYEKGVNRISAGRLVAIAAALSAEAADILVEAGAMANGATSVPPLILTQQAQAVARIFDTLPADTRRSVETIIGKLGTNAIAREPTP